MKTPLLLSLVLTLCLTPVAFGNPLLLAPTGTTLTTGQVRAEAAISPSNDNGKLYWFATGLSQFEFNVIRSENSAGRGENLIGLQWGFLPETSITPAISFGVRDVAAQSAEGVGVYAAVTKHLPISMKSIFLNDFSLTAGVGAAGIRGAFFGFEAKLPWNLFAQGEFDSKDFNAAAGWQPVKLVRLKAYTIHKDLFFGAELVPISF